MDALSSCNHNFTKVVFEYFDVVIFQLPLDHSQSELQFTSRIERGRVHKLRKHHNPRPVSQPGMSIVDSFFNVDNNKMFLTINDKTYFIFEFLAEHD